ncbi:uracil-DNA glycosylase family protein [Winogradskyella helgolandensis]|uniref:hypothetical protein n=1 Tax=Winogradskyella helgolandensis TaxID=2697010 RepID=UPI0015BB5D2D|nr:hypothetical protein [Winogradskyella helgolandensis]
MVISHACYENNWVPPEAIEGAKTLILGSFNPYNANGNNTDYYYGRQSNYFWKVIANLLGENQHCFTNNFENKLNVMNDYKFCFLDVISSIEISNLEDNQELIEQFANAHIYANFSDSKLFTTSHNNAGVVLNRTYNQDVIDLIKNQSIKKVIHTMGNKTITQNYRTKWLENSLAELGFQGYINSILNTNIEFVPESISPSQFAVHNGGGNYLPNLTNWISQHLEINQH